MEGDDDRATGLVLSEHHRERDAWVALVAMEGEVMTVEEMIEWLKTQDQSAVVNVVYHTNCVGYTVDFDPAKYSTYLAGYVKIYAAVLLLGVFEK
jgi:hypothetical protein